MRGHKLTSIAINILPHHLESDSTYQRHKKRKKREHINHGPEGLNQALFKNGTNAHTSMTYIRKEAGTIKSTVLGRGTNRTD